MIPDVVGVLPAIRYVVGHTGPYGGGIETRSLNMSHVWVADEQTAVCFHDLAHYSPRQQQAAMERARNAPHGWHFWGGAKPPKHGTPAPELECSCGFYGWYPWMREERRWNFSRTGTAEPSQSPTMNLHPASSEIVSWMVRNQPGAVPTYPIALVIDVAGRVVVHDSGVRAERACVRHVIVPEREDVVPAGYEQTLNRVEKRALDLKYRALSHWTNRVAENYRVSTISLEGALALEQEWDAIRAQIIEGDLGGGLR